MVILILSVLLVSSALTNVILWKLLVMKLKITAKNYKQDNTKLREALDAWKYFDAESSDKHPCPDPILRKNLLRIARELTEKI